MSDAFGLAPLSTSRTNLRHFHFSPILRRLKPYDEEHEEGLNFRDNDLSRQELLAIFPFPNLNPELVNRLLKVLHARRVDGTIDIRLDEELLEFVIVFPEAQDVALEWLRAQYPVDEDEAILARFKREEAPRQQEHPSALMERGQRLGLFKTQDASQKEDPDYYGPQSGQYYAQVSENQDDVFGRSELDRIRAENEAKAEEEDRKMQERVDQSMIEAKAKAAEAQAKAGEQPTALAERQDQSVELADGRVVRPPNEFEKWVIRAQERASSGITLDSPEVVNMSSTQRILPSLLFVLASCVGLYYFAQYWQPPRRTERMFPNVSMSVATCGGILAANAAIFVLWRFPPAWRLFNKWMLVSPVYPHFASMLGNIFSHITFRHFSINMLSLFIFGPSLHEDIGRANFLAIYLASGLLGSLFSLSSFVARGILYTTSNGASGCTWGITTAYLWLHKDDKFSFIFVPEQYQQSTLAEGWMLLLALVVFDTVQGIRKVGIDVVAHWTGMAVGLVTSTLWKAEHGDELNRGNKPSLLANTIDEIKSRLQK